MIIDNHTHLDNYDDKIINIVINEIDKNRIITLSNSMDVKSYKRNQEISKKTDYIFPYFGIPPWNEFKYAKKLNTIDTLINESEIFGEIGLDFYFIKEKKDILIKE